MDPCIMDQKGGVSGIIGHGFKARVCESSSLVRVAQLAKSCLAFDPLARPSMEEVAQKLQVIYFGEFSLIFNREAHHSAWYTLSSQTDSLSDSLSSQSTVQNDVWEARGISQHHSARYTLGKPEGSLSIFLFFPKLEALHSARYTLGSQRDLSVSLFFSVARQVNPYPPFSSPCMCRERRPCPRKGPNAGASPGQARALHQQPVGTPRLLRNPRRGRSSSGGAGEAN